MAYDWASTPGIKAEVTPSVKEEVGPAEWGTEDPYLQEDLAGKQAIGSTIDQVQKAAQDMATGFMQRNDFASNLLDNAKLFGQSFSLLQRLPMKILGNADDPSLLNDLQEAAGAAKSLKDKPLRLDWNPKTRAKVMDNLGPEYDVTPYEREAYIKTGNMPHRIVEGELMKEERIEAAIESKGGTLRVLSDSISQNPKSVAAELGKYMLANPQYLMLPQAYSRTAAALAMRMNQVAAKAGGVVSEATLGAVLAGSGAAFVEARERGMVSGRVVEDAMKLGGGAGLILATGQALLTPLRKAGSMVQDKTGIISEDAQAEIIRYSRKHDVSLQVAAARVMETHGLDPKVVVDEINKISRELGTALDPEYVGPPTREQSATMLVEAQQAKRAKPEVQERAPVTGREERIKQTQQKPEVQYGLDDLTSQAPPESFVASRPNAYTPAAAASYGDAAYALFNTKAYRPKNGAVTKPIMTMDEFKTTGLAKDKNGKLLSGAALKSRYEKFHKEAVQANRDPDMVITLDELRDIMMERSPEMKRLFLRQGRKKDVSPQSLPKELRGRKFPGKGQKGEIDSRLIATMGIAGVTALVTYAHTKGDFETAFKYAMVAGGGLLAARFLRAYLKGKNPVLSHVLATPKARIDLNKFYNNWQGDMFVAERQILSLRESLYELSAKAVGARGTGKLSPSAKKLREQVTDALEGGDISKLPPLGQEIARIVRAEFDKTAELLKKTDLVKEDDIVNNYVAHLWQHPTKSVEEVIDAIFGDVPRGLATKSMHTKKRVIPTYQAGEAAGLKPRTKDIADILAIYQKSITQARLNTELVRAFKASIDPMTGKPLVIKGVENAPKTYRTVNHPRFAGHAVHPDIAPVIKSIFDVKDFSAPVRGALAVNFFLKRMAVSLSAFHAKALLASALMAGGLEKGLKHPITSVKNLIDTFRGKSPHLEMLRKGQAGDEIDLLLRNGLVLNTVDDVGSDTFYASLADMQGALDSATNKFGPILGLPTAAASVGTRAIRAANLWTDGIMWDRIYTGFKISTALDKMQKLSARYGDTVSKDEMARIASEFTNDAFGGLNWTRLAENVSNKYGRQLAYNIVSRGGRAGMQTLLFAPDWTVANLRVFYRAIANKNEMSRKLHQGYMLRGLLLFTIAADGVQLALNGKHIWENDDPTSIELGDGTRLSLSKQFYEPYKWMVKPEQEALNKLSTMLSTSLQVMTGQKWLTGPGQYSPPIENRLTHVLQRATPIWMQQGFSNESLRRAAMSMAGFPVFGAEKEPKIGIATKPAGGAGTAKLASAAGATQAGGPSTIQQAMESMKSMFNKMGIPDPAPVPSKKPTVITPKGEMELPLQENETIRMLKAFEGDGKRGRPGYSYKDSLGFRTVGYGTLLEKKGTDGKPTGVPIPEVKKLIERMGLNFQDVWNGSAQLNQQQMDFLFQYSYGIAKEDSKKLVKNYQALPIPVQSVLTQMVYQMGYQGASEFQGFIREIQKDTPDYELAAMEMLYKDGKDPKKGTTDWYQQTPERAKALADLISSLSVSNPTLGASNAI